MKMNKGVSHKSKVKPNKKLYTAKDIKKYLGIRSNTLYHWTQTKRLFKPKVEEFGRGRVNKYSLENLATLSLVKVLNSHNIELYAIRDILNRILSPHFVKVAHDLSSKRKRIIIKSPKEVKKLAGKELDTWSLYRENKKICQKHGLFLVVSSFITEKEKAVVYIIDDLIGAKNRLESMAKDKGDYKDYTSMIFVDLVSIIKDLEEITGEEF